jgi:putative acetyltransferase
VIAIIREEMRQDHEAISEVNRLAFAGDGEAQLVDRLRADGLVVASLVAVEQDQVVGHILLSELPIETERGLLPAVSLAPMAVRPAWQRRGVGSALVRAGLTACQERGKVAVMVLGHPTYYTRFGFSPALAKPLQSPYSCAGEAWMAMDLTPGALTGVTGTVRYPEAFSRVN